jgi:dephospho-CoA kinase
MIIGLTGGIGSGKSTVGSLFKKHDIEVIDADDCARDALNKPSSGYFEFINKFGDSFLDKNNEIDRRKLRKYIFNNKEKQKELELIVHPIVRKTISDFVLNSKSLYTIIIVPLIYETDSANNYDRIIVVDCDKEIQLKRASSRDQSSPEEILKIINNQASREERLSIAHDVIINNTDILDLEKQVNTLHKKYSKIL